MLHLYSKKGPKYIEIIKGYKIISSTTPFHLWSVHIALPCKKSIYQLRSEMRWQENCICYFIIPERKEAIHFGRGDPGNAGRF